MAQPFIALAAPRKDARELRAYFMRHKTGTDIGFSWDEHDSRFPADQWERIPAVAECAQFSSETDVRDFEMRIMHEFLQWNRSLAAPIVQVSNEYAVARKVLKLAGLVCRDGASRPVSNEASLLNEARRALSSSAPSSMQSEA